MIHDATFLIGSGVLAGLGNRLLLGYLMYRSNLVPRRLALLGLIGGPPVSASGLLVLLGFYEQLSVPRPSPRSRSFLGAVVPREAVLR